MLRPSAGVTWPSPSHRVHCLDNLTPGFSYSSHPRPSQAGHRAKGRKRSQTSYLPAASAIRIASFFIERSAPASGRTG